MTHAIDVAVYTVMQIVNDYFLTRVEAYTADPSDGNATPVRNRDYLGWGDLANDPAYRLEMASYSVVKPEPDGSCYDYDNRVNTAGFAVVHKETNRVDYFISLGETTRLDGVKSQRDHIVNKRVFRRAEDAYALLHDGSYLPTTGVRSVEVKS
jgi:hypothetical protein